MTKAQHRLNKRIEHLTRSNDDLYQFAYLAAHKLRAPLVTIDGFLSLAVLKDRISTSLNLSQSECLGLINVRAKQNEVVIVVPRQPISVPVQTRFANGKVSSGYPLLSDTKKAGGYW